MRMQGRSTCVCRGWGPHLCLPVCLGRGVSPWLFAPACPSGSSSPAGPGQGQVWGNTLPLVISGETKAWDHFIFFILLMVLKDHASSHHDHFRKISKKEESAICSPGDHVSASGPGTESEGQACLKASPGVTPAEKTSPPQKSQPWVHGWFPCHTGCQAPCEGGSLGLVPGGTWKRQQAASSDIPPSCLLSASSGPSPADPARLGL